jgi:hypothetical protein
MLGDRTYDELFDYPSLVRAFDIDAPSGWPDRAAYLQDLTRALEAIHAYEAEPFHQSLRRGSQAAHLLQADDPAIRALPAALDGAVRAYIEGLGEGSDPLRRRRTASYVIEGMWSVRLRPGGFHIDHVHPMGWISSALHIRTVDRPGKEGWLRFGRPVSLHRRALKPNTTSSLSRADWSCFRLTCGTALIPSKATPVV